ncbi:hypothetical protein KAR63_06435 [Weissella uvarum]|uniref:hypothetical protein n=1 Tax=Weissella uvarum TaxID=1479233 RepID=UPI00195FDEFD|nr:hypothetical protein [Weissella uvarum]MCM0595823.1 hypothetical protein [Weissella uvarum]
MNWPIWLLIVVFAFVEPLLVKMLNIPLLWAIVGIYLLVNVGFSIWLARTLKHRGALIWMLLVWPILFAVAVVIGWVPAIYGYAFAILYLAVEGLAFFAGQRNDQDYEDQIPIENGYHEV